MSGKLSGMPGKFFPRELLSRIWQAVGLRGCLRGTYTRALEDEVGRLRAENRALMNSIFGVAGVPPGLDVRGWRLEAGKRANADSSSRRAMRATPRNDNDGEDRKNAGVGLAGGHGTAPCAVRRRSWRQIGRALEIEDARAARRERESDTEAFPAPRDIVPRVERDRSRRFFS